MRGSIKLGIITLAIVISITMLVASFDYSGSALQQIHVTAMPGTSGGVVVGSGNGVTTNGTAGSQGSNSANVTSGKSTGEAVGTQTPGLEINNSFLKFIAGIILYIASSLSGLIPSLATTLTGFGSWLSPQDTTPASTAPQSQPSVIPPTAVPTTSAGYTDPIMSMALPAIALLAVLIAIAYIVLKKYNIPLVQKPSAQVNLADEPLSFFEGSYKLSFPQVAHPFPLLWGEGETVGIEVALPDGASEDVIVLFDGVDCGSIRIENGNASFTLSPEKGRHRLEIRPGDEVAGRTASWADIRIVDYREEVVGIFNRLFTHFKAGDERIQDDMTPREAEMALSPALPEDKRPLLADAVTVFEVANYSMHGIGRPDYEKMYLSDIGIKGMG